MKKKTPTVFIYRQTQRAATVRRELEQTLLPGFRHSPPCIAPIPQHNYTSQAMRASQHHAPPQALPLPPPPLSLRSPSAAPRRGRHSNSHSSSSSSSSCISGPSPFCPSPPFPHASTTSSLVPFSWERHAGVPKNSSRHPWRAASPTCTPLPPPPPLRPAPRRRRAKAPATSSSDAKEDPFVAAFAECTRDDDYAADVDGDSNKLAPVPAKKAAVVSPGRAERRRWMAGGGGLVAFLDMHGCKSAMDVVVADGTFQPRAGSSLLRIIDPRPRQPGEPQPHAK
jgi:hypothetical protein